MIESLDIKSSYNSAKTKSSKSKDILQFIELSNAIYSNRPTHDKSFHVSVDEIDFIIGINNIVNNKENKDVLCQLIGYDYNELFDYQLVEIINELTITDFNSLCSYNRVEDTYSGIEYHILSHLIAYHLDEFEKDLYGGNLSSIIKLKIEKGNLIVIGVPSKSTANNPVSYVISLLYLVIFHLYMRANQEFNVVNIIKRSFLSIKPIVTKVVYTLTIKADDNYTWFNQLGKLKPNYPFLEIKQKGRQVQYFFKPKENYLMPTLDCPVVNTTPSDKKSGYRSISCNFTLNKDNTLQCHTTIISKDMVDCVFATEIDEPDEPASIYSTLSDNEEYYHATYSIIERIWTFTKEYEEARQELNIKISELVRNGKLDLIGEYSQDEKVKYLTNGKLQEHVFQNIEIMNRDDMLIPLILHYLAKKGIKNGCVPYVIVIRELMYKNKDIIDDTLAILNSNESDVIRKVINEVKDIGFIEGMTLNQYCSGVNYA